MPKAKIALPDGTVVEIEGTPEEVAKLLSLYGASKDERPSTAENKAKPKKKRSSQARKSQTIRSAGEDSEDIIDVAAIVNIVKDCDEAENIETAILDKTSVVDRILLPLYIVQLHMGGSHTLTSGDISKVTSELGIPVSQPNTSRALSGTASKYVMGDKARKKGQAVKYKISRRGVKYIESVLVD